MKAVVAAFNQEKALVGAFSVIVQPVVEPMDRFTALTRTEASYHRRVALIMAVITVAFLVCWWPYAVIFMLGDRVPRIDTTNISRCIHIICLLA